MNKEAVIQGVMGAILLAVLIAGGVLIAGVAVGASSIFDPLSQAPEDSQALRFYVENIETIQFIIGLSACAIVMFVFRKSVFGAHPLTFGITLIVVHLAIMIIETFGIGTSLILATMDGPGWLPSPHLLIILFCGTRWSLLRQQAKEERKSALDQNR